MRELWDWIRLMISGILSFFRPKKEALPCGLCGDPLGENPGILRYVALDEEGVEGTFTLDVCSQCSDVLDREGKRPEVEAE